MGVETQVERDVRSVAEYWGRRKREFIEEPAMLFEQVVRPAIRFEQDPDPLVEMQVNAAICEPTDGQELSARSVSISMSQASSCSDGRALTCGNAPTMPARHSAFTSGGNETRNMGAPITGTERVLRRPGGSAGERRPCGSSRCR